LYILTGLVLSESEGSKQLALPAGQARERAFCPGRPPRRDDSPVWAECSL